MYSMKRKFCSCQMHLSPYITSWPESKVVLAIWGVVKMSCADFNIRMYPVQ